ncbi:hypothetical protein L484_025830 [Morus notabilis]|uniref:Uncharacterized protein n=1 Tax=Morus notabilis TaxID=981085 RepID=W9RAP2_9ROSA|nr:hypothetical protein L484_025830 [Morus notabilis]
MVIHKDLEVADLEGANFAKVANKALRVDKAEKKVLEANKEEREKQDMYKGNQSRGFLPKFHGNRFIDLNNNNSNINNNKDLNGIKGVSKGRVIGIRGHKIKEKKLEE